MANEKDQEPQIGKDGAKKGDGPHAQPADAQSDSQRLDAALGVNPQGQPKVGRVVMGNMLAAQKDVDRARKDAEAGGVVLDDEEQSPFDESGKLTHEGATRILANGGSVMFNGKTYPRDGELPSAAEFAKGDAKAEQAVLASLDRRQAQLDAERALLAKQQSSSSKK